MLQELSAQMRSAMLVPSGTDTSPANVVHRVCHDDNTWNAINEAITQIMSALQQKQREDQASGRMRPSGNSSSVYGRSATMDCTDHLQGRQERNDLPWFGIGRNSGNSPLAYGRSTVGNRSSRLQRRYELNGSPCSGIGRISTVEELFIGVAQIRCQGILKSVVSSAGANSSGNV